MNRKFTLAMASMALANGVFCADDALKALYKFDEGSGVIAVDASPLQNNADLINLPTWFNDDSFTALQFNKTQQTYLTCGRKSSLSGTGDFTLSGWVKTSTKSTMSLLSQRAASTEALDGLTNSFTLNITGKGKIDFRPHNGKSPKSVCSTGKVNDGAWHHFAVTRQSGTVKIFIDGILDAQKAGLNHNFNGDLPLTIGAQVTTATQRYFYHGLLDDLSIRSEALTEAELAFLAANHNQTINADADADGLTNRQELLAGLNPFNADSDSDNLNDSAELAAGTDPNVQDSDGDGVLDGDEVADFTDPLTPNGNVPRGWMATTVGLVSEDTSIDYFEESDSFNFHTQSKPSLKSGENFAFTYKKIRGDFSITAKVDSSLSDNVNADAGLMIRNGLSDIAKFASISLTPAKGTKSKIRVKGGKSIDTSQTNIGKNPYWVRILKQGSTVSTFLSPDGAFWTAHKVRTGIQWQDELYVGLFAASGDENLALDAAISQVAVVQADDLDQDTLLNIEEQMLTTSEVLPDTDADQMDDQLEIEAGHNPVIAPIVKDGKTYQKAGLVTRYTRKHYLMLPDFDQIPVNKVFIMDGASLGKGWKMVQLNAGEGKAALSMQAMINVPADGDYTFYVASKDGSRLIIDDQVVVDNDGVHPLNEESGSITLTAGLHKFDLQYFYYEQLGAELWTSWSGPGFGKAVISNYSFVHAQEDYDEAVAEIDTDSDGLTDLKEAKLGSDPNDADSNDDGLTDGEKYDLGLDIFGTDSDGDGISDFVEVKETFTNPKLAEFDGTITDVVTIDGKDVSESQGEWDVEGDTIVAKRARGYVEYKFTVTESDAYHLAVEATHLWLKYSCSPVSPIDNSDLMIYLDGRYLGKKNLVAPDGIYGKVGITTPYMRPGEHTVRIFWENVHSRISLKIKDLKVQTLGGPDSNGDGVKDWVETSIASTESLNTVPAESFVSPLCIEGNSRYVDMMSINDARLTIDANQSAGAKWFADIDLAADGDTTITAKFQNGGLTKAATTKWTALNLLNPSVSEIIVRKGDSVKFAVAEVSQNSNQALSAEDVVTITIDGVDTTTSPATSVTKLFDTAGTFTVSGSVNALNGAVTVKVIETEKPAENPAFMIGKGRTWHFDGLADDAVLEYDETVGLSRDGEQLKIRMNKINRPHHLIVRAYENGPILQTVKLEGFWIQAAVDNYVWVVEKHDDYDVWENTLIAKNVPESIDIELKITKAGAFFAETGDLEQWLGKAELDELGEFAFRLIHPHNLSGSTCHSIKAYQNGVEVGSAYHSGILLPEDD